MTEDYNFKLELLQLYQDPARESVLKHQVQTLNPQINRLVADGNFDDIETRSTFQVLIDQLSPKAKILQFIQYPTNEQSLKEEIQKLKISVNEIFKNGDFDDFGTQFIFQFLNDEYMWKEALVKLIQDPTRESILKHQVQTLNAEINNLVANGNFDRIDTIVRFKWLTSECNQKTQILQLIKWTQSAPMKILLAPIYHAQQTPLGSRQKHSGMTGSPRRGRLDGVA